MSLTHKFLLNMHFLFLRDYFFFFQHASSDVERMILGNKCDMNEKRQVSKEKGEKVSFGDLPCSEAYFS